MFNDNPYASPVDVEKGIYSHKLFWRFVKAISAICFIIFIADIFIYLRWFEIEPANGHFGIHIQTLFSAQIQYY